MESSGHNSHWIGRIIGAVAITGASFVSLWYWDTWELSRPVRIAVSITLGVLFIVFGGSVWRWIEEIDLMS